MNKVYKITLNWKGEVHTFYSDAAGTARAKRNAIARLARELGLKFGAVNLHFTGERDNYHVELVKDS